MKIPEHLKEFLDEIHTLSDQADPDILVQILSLGNNDLVSCYAARNINYSKETLIEILKRGNDDEVSQAAARNRNCPREILTEVLKKGNDDVVSEYAAKNPNCPPKVKLQWMLDHGYIHQEDSEDPKIDEEKEINEDLLQFKELIDNATR